MMQRMGEGLLEGFHDGADLDLRGAQQRPADVLSRLWPSESGMTADPLTSGLSCGFAWCRGWRSNRSPQVNPMLIPMVISQRMSPYAHVISEIVTSGGYLDARYKGAGCGWA